MSSLKRVWKFISSMKFAILLLAVLSLACAAGSFVTQGQTYEWYARQTSERTAALILALGLDDAFHSAWFLVITGFLCLNLLLCNVLRLPPLIRRTAAAGAPPRTLNAPFDARVDALSDPESLFGKLRMPAPKRSTDDMGREVLFASKHRAGLWGAWVCHLGILLLILGFALGQATREQYTVYGVPGDVRPIGDTGYMLVIDDFRIGLRADDTVEQYTADITVYDMNADGAPSRSATISVNNPATLYGMKFFQNSTGWAATVRVLKSGEEIQREVVCAGDYLTVKDNADLVVCLNAFYPDYVFTPGVGPSTASGKLDNPAYLYSVYYQERMLGMNALMEGEELTIDDYTVTFSDPQSYTLIQVKRDRFTWLALAGGLIVLAGLALALYAPTARVWAIRDANGAWTAFGACPKGGALFRERFQRAAQAKEDTTDASS